MTSGCDCCGRLAEVSRSWAYGIETWACEKCRDPEWWRRQN